MQLSAEQFEAVIGSIKYQTVAVAAAELRKHPRIGVRGQVTIILLHADQELRPISVGVTDVSPHGIGLVHDHPIDVGQQFILCMSYVGAESTRAIMCTVRRREPVENGQFLIGCEFGGNAITHAETQTEEVLPGLSEFQLAAAAVGATEDANA